MYPTFNFTPESFDDFKKRYQAAVDEKKDSFEFEGHPVVVGYAKYVIEYLTNVIIKNDLSKGNRS